MSYVPAELISRIVERLTAGRLSMFPPTSTRSTGGYIVQSSSIGQQAGRMTLRIFAGDRGGLRRIQAPAGESVMI